MSFLISGLSLLFLLILSGIFSATETALFSLTKLEKKRLEERHPKFAKYVLGHLDHPRRTLVSIIIGNLLIHTLATAMVTLIALKILGPGGLGIAITIFTILLIFFGEIIPKTIAVKYNEIFSVLISVPLHLFAWIILPFEWLTRVTTETILSFLVREKKEKADHISEGELKTLVKIGEEEGVLDSEERRMIHKVFELGERPVKDIMVHRVDLKALDMDDSQEEHIELIKRFHFGFFPVYQDTIDNVLGIVPAQEYMLHPDGKLSDLMIQPLFVPETKRIDDLLAEFREKKQRFAICVDEHGGTDGIVTLEDILEEIFGEFYDEYETVKNPIRPYGHQREFIVDAKVSLTDFNEYFGTEIEAEESTTLGGFILERMGEVPKRGTLLETDFFEFKIHDVIRHRRIRTVIVKPKELED